MGVAFEGREMKYMNVYDFDGTIYNGDSSVRFYLFALRRHPALVRFFPMQLFGICGYLRKKFGKTKMKECFFSFLQGVDAERLAEEFWEQNYAGIQQWYLDRKEPEDVVISASPEFLLLPICRRLGIRHLIASRVDPQTGRFTGKNCYGREKAFRLQTEMGVCRVDGFYSDSVSDLPLAELADHAWLIRKGVIQRWNV